MTMTARDSIERLPFSFSRFFLLSSLEGKNERRAKRGREMCRLLVLLLSLRDERTTKGSARGEEGKSWSRVCGICSF